MTASGDTSSRAILDELTRGFVPIAFAAATCVYAGLSAMGLGVGSEGRPAFLVYNVWVSALVCGAIAYRVHTRGISARWAHPALIGLCALMSTNCGAFLYWAQDPVHTTNQMLLLLALGASMYSWRWFATGAAIVFASWLVTAIPAEPFSVAWRHWTAMMGVSLLAGVLLPPRAVAAR